MSSVGGSVFDCVLDGQKLIRNFMGQKKPTHFLAEDGESQIMGSITIISLVLPAR